MKILSAVVLAKTALLILFILYGGVGLGPDEAQYWTWSQALAPGYYSKPPGIAYQIAWGTWLFGHTELGVRFGSLVIAALMPFLIYALAKRSYLSYSQATWAGVIWALCPLGWIGALLAITDGGMILFWTLACLCLLSERPWWLLGLTVAFGALFKWPIYSFWLFAFAYRRDRKLLGAALLSLLGFLPAVWWNATHDWVTFRHVGATLQGGSGAVKGHSNFFEFIGAQIAFLSPIFFITMLLAYRKRAEGLRLSYLITLPSLVIGALLALFMKVQGNWAIFAYPTAPLLAVAGAGEKKGWLYSGLALSLLMVLVGYLFVPLKHNTGWKELAPLLQQAGFDPQRHFLAADKYQNTAILSFYSPGQKRAYFLNLKGDRLNQFSFWSALKDDYLHGDGFFVTFEAEEPALAPYFATVEKLGPFPLTPQKQVTLYHVHNYNGKEPNTPVKY